MRFLFLNKPALLLSTALACAPLYADEHAAEDSAAAAQHLGVASCASTACHGSVQPFPEARIQHNEYITWQTDRHGNMHAKAYAKLLTPEAVAIAAKLKLGAPEQAEECLSCHTDYVPAAQRGPEFQLSDGVGCEACHGGAGEYIDTHSDRNRSLTDNQRDGMYPTWEPRARAELCLGCHMGNAQRRIDHRIMGAGHPRLQFELDTFTYLQPHHRVDDDYIERKGRPNSARDWAVGQALAAANLLDMLQHPQLGWHGVFLEPLLLDCHSCHRRLDSENWQQRAGTGLGPGEMRLNDANLVMVRLIVSAINPDLAARLQQQTLALHQATTVNREALMTAAAQLRQTLTTASAQLARHEFADNDLEAILAQLQRQAEGGELRDYAAAEQSAMAVVNLVSAWEQTGMLGTQALEPEIERLFATVADEYEYRPTRLADALQRIRTALGAGQ